MSRSSERYRKLEQAAEQTSELAVERWALTEVLGRMRADVRALEAGAESAERDRAALESKLETEAQRDAQMAREISELQGQAAAVRLQIAAAARRLDALCQQAAVIESALLDKQHEMSDAQTLLGGAVERVSRLDYKLRIAMFSSSLERR
jgi:chromosome segregation ATPase